MRRGWKIFLSLVLLAVIALGTLPWWLGPVLRPILRAQRITFERYERLGYTRFKLHQVQYTHPSVVITAGEVQVDTPLCWLALRLRHAEPMIIVDHWLLRHTPTPAVPNEKKQLNGMADLQRLLIRLVPILHRWLPAVQLNAGELRGFTPEMTLAHAVWRDSTLKVEGLGIVGRDLTVVIAHTPADTFTVAAHAFAQDTRAQLIWSADEIKGQVAWWDQPIELDAHFAATGWLPAEASALADHWDVAAARLKLGAPYQRVHGRAQLKWNAGAYEISLEGKAEPDTKTKAPAFEAQGAARGDFRELTLTALHINAPFATAKLSAPVTFSVTHPLSAGAAELSIKVDLEKFPWLEARGKAEGRVTVAAGTTGPRQTFELDFNNVSLENYALEKAHVRGVLEWPLLTLETFEARLDKTSFVSAHGAVDWQTRELRDVSLQAKVGPGWFARWLPKDASWASAEITATAQGSFDAPQHQGSLAITQVVLKPLQPLALNASWQGNGTKVEIQSAKVTANTSTVALTGTVEENGFQLSKLVFSPHGQPAWQLVAPVRLTWSPVWQIEELRLAGPAAAAKEQVALHNSGASLTLAGHGGADGLVDLTATAFDSAWLQDWITVTGPQWQIHTLQAHGREVRGVLAFDTTLTGQIAMDPRPAEFRLNASGDASGIQLKELTVVESGRELTRATGKLPVAWKLQPSPQLSVDETAPLQLSAVTEPDSPLWSALSAYTGLKLLRPEARIELKGTVREPSGEVRIHAAQLAVGEGRFKISPPVLDDVTLAMQVDRKMVTLSTLATKVDGQELKASGQLPMDDAHWEQLWHAPKSFDWRNATARVEIPDADLAALAAHFPTLIAPKGRLRAKVELASGGKFYGELHLTDATARPVPPFSTLQEINADLTLADRTFTIQKLTAKLGGEPVVVDGSVTLAANGTPQLALGLKGKNLPLVRNPGLLIRNDIDLHANTDNAGVTRLSGLVTLRDCLVLANLSALLPTGQRGVTRQPPYFAVEAEPFRGWPLAVEVRGLQVINIRTTVFSGTASAHFQLGGTLGEPRAVGEVTVDKGQVLFPFATFGVQTGTLRLREADPFHAVVNLNATSQRRDYQLRLEATGQLPTPNIVLSSTPALEAEEVLLMVMTGQPPSNTDVTISSASERLALLGAYLGRGIFQDLGFGGEDRLEISAGEQVSLQGRETYDFEYKLSDRWSLTGEYDRFDAYNAGVKWRVYTQESKPVEKK